MNTITISFIGDVMLGRNIKYGRIERKINTFREELEYIDEKNYSERSLKKIYGDTLDILKKSDMVIGNLESTITDSDDMEFKTFNFMVNTKYARALIMNDNMFLNMANNHILDYKERGALDTIKVLKRVGIKHAGAGLKDESRKHVVYRIKNRTIGIYSCADYPKEWESTDDRVGINYVDMNNYEEIITDIERIKGSVDILILSIHWGRNKVRGVEEKYRRFADRVLKAGVKIIHGHSSHHVKCIEHDKKNNYVVMYGMGDYVNDYAIDEEYRTDLGMIVNVTINKKMEVEVIPTKIENRQVNVAEDKQDKQEVLGWVTRDCEKARIEEKN